MLQSVQLLLRIRISDLQIRIGVIATQGGHGQNLPGIDIHHNAKSAILHIIAGNGCLHFLFQTSLNRCVQRKDHTAASLGFHQLFIGIGHIHFIIALAGDHPSCRALQIGVIGCLYPFAARIGGIGKTDNLRCQRTIGIVALGIRLQMNSGDLIGVDVCANGICCLFADLGSDLLIPLGDVFPLLQNPLRISIQKFSQYFRDSFQIRFGLF